MSARPNTRSLSQVSRYLRHIAELFDASGVDELPAPAQVSVHVSPAIGGAASVALVDVVAAVLGAAPTWDRRSGGEFAWYGTGLNPDDAVWSVRSTTYTRHPFGDLRSENDALRARLAEIEALASVRTNVPVALAQTARDRMPPVIDGSPSDLDGPPAADADEFGDALQSLGLVDAPADFDGEHKQVYGVAGDPGGCEAECACGTTFAGFDTHKEAAALLDEHIVRANNADDGTNP